MSREKAKGFTLGILVSLLPAVGVAWAFATFAAERVLRPHITESSLRVEMMCAWAKAAEERDQVQIDNQAAICARVGASCKTPPDLPPNPLLDKCTPRQ